MARSYRARGPSGCLEAAPAGLPGARRAVEHGSWMVALCAGLALSCGSATQFEDKTPLVFNAPAPEPEPEPEPPQVAQLVAKPAPQLNQTLEFSLDSAALVNDALSRLREVTDILQQSTEIRSVQVEGHASEEGTEQHNQRLSEARARAVRAYLIAQGIDSERLSAKGFGESQPIADNGSEEGRRQNRRVEFNILSVEGS